MNAGVNRYYTGDLVVITLDLQIYDQPTDTFLSDPAPGVVTVALLSDDEKTIALAAVTAVADPVIVGRVSATFAAVATAALAPGFYRVDARRTTGPATYDRPRISFAPGRPA